MIKKIEIKTDKDGRMNDVYIEFGPHFLIHIESQGEKTNLALGYTHHGFRADASIPGGQLEQFIDAIRRANPEASFD